MITFAQSWTPNGVPTNVSSATIGIFDATTSTQVVANGTAMTNTSTGNYSYEYSSDVGGHTYNGTIVFVAVGGAKISYQQVVYVPPSGTIPTSADDGSNAYISGVYATERGLWTNIRNAAQGAIAIALAAGEGPSYSISGRVASESLSLNEFLANMRDTAAKATSMEFELTQALQDVNLFDVRQRVGIRNRW